MTRVPPTNISRPISRIATKTAAPTALLEDLSPPRMKGRPRVSKGTAVALLKPISDETASSAAAQKKAKSALEFMDSLSAKPGWAYSIDDYDKLPEPVKAVLTAFAAARFHTAALAGDYGAARKQTETPGNDFHASELVRRLDVVLAPYSKRASGIAAMLESAAKGTGLEESTRSMLRKTAVIWRDRAQAPGWKAATSLAPVGAPKSPKRPEPKKTANSLRGAEGEMREFHVYHGDTAIGTKRVWLTGKELDEQRRAESGLDELEKHGLR
jgi:hypothetical protein